MRARRWWVALAWAGVAVGCKTPEETTTPGDDELSAFEGDEVAGKASDDPPLPQVQDRDPEEEKKKMSLSKQRSAQARQMLEAGRLADAVTHSREALKIHEQNVDAMLVIAEVFYRQGKYELTQAVTATALAVDPEIRTPQESSTAHNLMAFALLAMGREEGATKAFRAAAEADDKNAAAWNNLGTRYLAAGDHQTALSCFDYALELQPNFAKAHLNRGAALRAAGQWQAAEQAFNQALKLQPSYAEVHFNLGVLYLDADPYPGLETVPRLERAISHLSKYRELAIAEGTQGPSKPGVPGAVGKPGGGKMAKGKPDSGAPPPVSVARADDYIRIAKKGIEREQRRAERAAERKARGDKPSAKEPDASQQGAGASSQEDAKPKTGDDAAKDGEAPTQPSTSADARMPSRRPTERAAFPNRTEQNRARPSGRVAFELDMFETFEKKLASAWNPRGILDTKVEEDVPEATAKSRPGLLVLAVPRAHLLRSTADAKAHTKVKAKALSRVEAGLDFRSSRAVALDSVGPSRVWAQTIGADDVRARPHDLATGPCTNDTRAHVRARRASDELGASGRYR